MKARIHTYIHSYIQTYIHTYIHTYVYLFILYFSYRIRACMRISGFPKIGVPFLGDPMTRTIIFAGILGVPLCWEIRPMGRLSKL